MKRFFTCLSAVFLLAITCNCGKNHARRGAHAHFSKADSIAATRQLFVEMHREMYADPMYTPPENEPAIIDCGISFGLTIRCNCQKEWMIRNELNPSITRSVLQYYTANQEKNDLGSGYPLYSDVTVSFIAQEADRIKQEIRSLKKNDADSEIIAYKQKMLADHRKLLRYMQILGTNAIRQVQYAAKVIIQYPDASCLPFPKTDLVDSVLTAFYMLRDRSAQKYFHRSYLDLFYNRLNETSNKAKLEALQTLHPIHVLDEPYFNRLNPGYGVIPPPLPKK